MKLNNRKAQNLIEFIIVIPILIILIFGIMEIAVFWRTANSVQQIALTVAESAASAYVSPDAYQSDDPTTVGVDETKTPSVCIANTITDDATTNMAVCRALERLQEKLPSLGFSNVKFTSVNMGNSYGSEPFMFYEYQNVATGKLKAGDIKIDIDYRDPYKNGVIVQLNYNYTTILLGCEFTLPGGNKITIIPRNMEISSTKIQQYNQF
ncbi:MAG: TadE/TadG family type IV pilus assembly protein [bacterium]